MTIWHVQKKYILDKVFYEVLPYDLAGTMRVALKMENGIRQMLQFLFDSRLTENTAHLLYKKKNVNCIICKE